MVGGRFQDKFLTTEDRVAALSRIKDRYAQSIMVMDRKPFPTKS